MPLTDKGEEILANMTRENGGSEKAGKREFYASINAGKITGVEGRKDSAGCPTTAYLQAVRSGDAASIAEARSKLK